MDALRFLPGLATLSRWSIRLAAALLPRLKIPFIWLGRFEHMVDERDPDFYRLWKADPLPIKAVSLRYMHSTFATPPAVPFERNRLPVLVINQSRDRMVRPEVTRGNYERLAGPVRYVEIDYGHWATSADFVREYTDIIAAYLQEQMRRA